MKHPMLVHVTVIGVAGFFGAVARYLVGHYVTQWLGVDKAHIGTLIINISACFLIGLCGTYFARPNHGIPEWTVLAVTTGFIGTYSTFSTYLWEVHKGLTLGNTITAMGYLFVSIVLGMTGVYLGVQAAKGL